MTVQIAIRLDDSLAEDVKTAAAAAGTNLSDWVRTALARQVVAARALRARAEEDARPLYSAEQDAALSAARRRRAIAALDER
jgi:hypothetical protein